MKIFKIEKQDNKIKLILFGIKISIRQKKLLNPFKKPVFRNDDVSVDSNLEHFKEFCEIFHKYGYTQLHAINLYGYTNCNYITDGLPTPYEGFKNLSTIPNDKIRELSQGKFIGDNKELIDYLNSIPDEIGLHGLYHTNYSLMTYEEQEADIKEGLRLLKELFPNKKVEVFIAPFNKTNEDTYKVCKKFGLRVSALEGEHLEDMIEYNKLGIKNGEIYRYHHHRFYPESTFSYYDLNLEKLDRFFRYNKHSKRKLPDKDVLADIVHKNKAQEWFIYSFNDFKNRKHAYLPYQWILKNINKEKDILETGCGAGGMLYHLYKDGYKCLSGYDYDEKAINSAKEISETIYAPINFSVHDGHNPKLSRKYDVIIGVNWFYHVPDYGLENFITLHLPYLKNDGYFVFDTIDAKFNDMPNNQYALQDWNKPVEERRASEYLYRYSKKDVENIAQKYNFEITYSEYIHSAVPHAVYVLKRKKLPQICLLCDRPNWAHDHSAQEIKEQLSDDFAIDIKYVIDKPNLKLKKYDLLHVFFWGEEYYKKFKFSKSKLIKQVSSHRWQDNPMYGPCTPEEFQKKYLYDADFVSCPSKILYDLLKDVCPKVFLIGKGYSPKKFYYTKARIGEMSICWAGNIKDPVKGVEDILIPSAEGYKLNLASNLKHEELLDFYNSHDIYTVTSKNEADPLPLIESMACGCFPVANYVGIAPELIRHKENGYLVKERTIDAYKEAFEWCKNNIEYIRSKQKDIAQEIYNSRRWEIMAQGYKKMYEECLNKKGEYKCF